MLRRQFLSCWLTVAVVVLTCAPVTVLAQEATPATARAATDLPIVAAGLTSPRGLTWGADGTLYVALAGAGGTALGTPATGPGYTGGPTASVVRIEAGCPVAVANGLPSTVNKGGA